LLLSQAFTPEEDLMSRLTRGLMATLLAMPMVAVPAGVSIWSSTPMAQAETKPPPGTDLKPVLGWSSWSFFRRSSDAAVDEAAARALKESGLERLGYRYVNQDDFWYQCPGHQGPNVDHYGRWVTRPGKFPPGPGGENGIQVVASYVHSLGLKFGIYVTPGISDQAVAKNTPIMGTDYTADQIATTTRQNNYNCGGMTGIDYSKPGAQAYVNSIVSEFASWGVDYIKLDGITDNNIADIQAWSNAIRQVGRPMQLDVTEGDYTTALGPTLNAYATQWEYTSDIENYGGKGLTDYANVQKRFTTLALWEPTYGGKIFDGYNDFDSVEVGDCERNVGSSDPFGSVDYPNGDGLTLNQRQTVLSLWSLASSPLILGTNLTELCRTDLNLLKDQSVLSVDQDGIDASMITNAPNEKVVAKTEPGGDVAVGLFNPTGQPETISTTASAIGLPTTSSYQLTNLWTHQASTSGSTITATVPPHGVAFYRVRP
jgi:Alpha galactosidase C-terminal beta sandwich domain/Alpha galactosidase A